MNKKIDVREMFVHSKVSTLWCGYRLKTNNEDLQKKFFDKLEQNNDLLQIFKSSERYCSLYGSSFLYFDIENNVPKIGIYKPAVENQTVKIDGLKEIAGVGYRQLIATQAGQLMSSLECRTENETKVQPIAGFEANTEVIPVGIFHISIPEIVKEKLKLQTITHNYGVLSMKQFLNKNIKDLETNETIFPDNYAVKHLEPLINEALNYLEEEQKTNKTRVFGSFSNQDILNRNSNERTLTGLRHLENAGLIDGTNAKSWVNNLKNTSILEDRFFVNTQGSGNEIKVHTGSLDITALVKGVNELIELYFNGCGLSYSLGQSNEGGAVKSIQEVRTQNKTSYETIKNTNALRKEQWEEFLERIMIAMGLNPETYKGQWSFEVVSNILDEDSRTPETIISLLNNKVIDQETAVRRANPDFNDYEIEDLLKSIEKEKVESKENNDIINDMKSLQKKGVPNGTK